MDVTKHLSQYAASRGQLDQYNGIWSSIARHFCPFVKFQTSLLPGANVTFDIYNDIGRESLLIFANGVTSWMMQQGSKWFSVEPSDENAPDDVKRVFAAMSDRLFKHISDTNLSSELVLNAMYSGAFNLSAIQIDRGYKKKLRFRTLLPGKFTVCSNEDGDVYDLFREFELDVHSLVEEFGVEALPDEVVKVYKENNSSKVIQKYSVLHHVWERKPDEIATDENGNDLDDVIANKRRFGEVYILKEKAHILKEDGRYTFPFAICRLFPATNGEYGVSLCEYALDTSSVLQKVEEDVLLAMEKMVKNSYFVSSDYEYQIDDSPGSVIKYNASAINAKPEAIQYNNRIDVASMGIERFENRIRRALFVDTFQLLKYADREKTAFETSQLIDERTIVIAPLLTNYLEQIKRLIMSCYDMLNRDGLLFTDEDVGVLKDYFDFEGKQFTPEIKFNNKISLLLKKLRDNGIVQALTLQAQAVQMGFPDAQFVIKVPEALREIFRGDVPVNLMYSEKEVEAIKQAQIEVAQQQEQLQTAQQTAEVANTMPPEMRSKFGI